METRTMEVVFPGGKRVDAHYEGFTIKTDQSEKSGGEGSAPPPFSLFLASIATCVGIYVLSFLQSRDISAEDARLDVRIQRDPDSKRIVRYEVDIVLPEGFPGKYRAAIVRAAELCAVKKTIETPPEFVVRAIPSDG